MLRTSATIGVMDVNRADAPYVQSPLDRGDLAASEGRWLNAIDDWGKALESSPSLGPQVGARIDWFLSRQERISQGANPVRDNLHLILLSLAAAIMATAFVLFPETPGSVNANVFAVGAWILILASATLAIVASRRIGGGGAGTGHAASKLERARQVAQTLGSERQPGP